MMKSKEIFKELISLTEKDRNNLKIPKLLGLLSDIARWRKETYVNCKTTDEAIKLQEKGRKWITELMS